MILVVGGAGAGKRDFVRARLGVGADEVADAELVAASCLDNLQDLLRDPDVLPDEAADPVGHAAAIDRIAAYRVVICDEVGCGLVPLDPAQARWRERVGRACCELARRATCVVRVCCGIPAYLKGRP